MSHQGGFAKCYEFINCESKQRYAGKVIEKASLVNKRQKQKVRLVAKRVAAHE